MSGTERQPQISPRRMHTAERLLGELRTEVARADTKASVLVAALAIAAAGVLGLSAGHGGSPRLLSKAGALLWWAGAACFVASLVCVLLAVLPRHRRRRWAPGDPLTYFGDVWQAVRAGHLEDGLAVTQREPLHALLTSLAENGRIAARKHLCIRVGLITFCIGTVLLPVALLIG